MNFKRFLAILLCLLLACTLSLALIGCGGNDEGGSENGGEGGGTGEGLVLVENGLPNFKFVFSKNISTAAKTLANSTIKSINKVLTKDAESDYESDTNAQDIEIIFGTPGYRGDEYAIDYHYLGPDGYAVKVVGTKVLVLYGSDNAVSNALDHLKSNVFGITSKTKKLTDVTVTADKLIEQKQTFTLQSATICGENLNNYVLDYPTVLRSEAQNMQNTLYEKVGSQIPTFS